MMNHEQFVAKIIDIGGNITQDMSHSEACRLEGQLLDLIERLRSEGLKLAPVEATSAMLDAASHASIQHLVDCIRDPNRVDELGSEENIRKTHASRYRAMLAAA